MQTHRYNSSYAGTCRRILLALALLLLASCTAQPPSGTVTPRSPVPAPPPYPTMEPRRWLGGSDPRATIQLPGSTLDIHVAVHPTQGWPAIAVLQRFNESRD